MLTRDSRLPIAKSRTLHRVLTISLCFCLTAGGLVAHGQTRPPRRDANLDTPVAQAKEQSLIQDVLLPEVSLRVDPRFSKLIRTRKPVSRFSITNPGNVEVVQFSPTEFELIGLRAGETTLTLWFGDGEVLRYLVTVSRDTDIEDRRQEEYGDLQNMVNEMFPNSSIQLIPIADKLIVRGQARDSEEAAQILSVISDQVVGQGGGLMFGGIGGGTAADPYPGVSELPASQIINLMDVPGEHQVMLKVRVAEISRKALRTMGSEVGLGDYAFGTGTDAEGAPLPAGGGFDWAALLSGASGATAVLSAADVSLAMRALSTNSYSKILAEPNLVTISGRPASFIAGGEFAVPVVVGIEGAAAATTNFRGFGTQITFLPTVIDKDRIRLMVAPSVSGIDAGLTVDGIPGLNTRAVTTTVDLREGQWLAIAGLIQDEQAGSKSRVPWLGDIPIVDILFSNRDISRGETELIILVSPELVHPLEPEEAPLILPGMEVTEPGDAQFFLYGNYEGNPACHHRSTVWNLQMRRALTAKHRERYQATQQFYIHGDHGFSQ
jgi:pilus assembly protein CpaC